MVLGETIPEPKVAKDVEVEKEPVKHKEAGTSYAALRALEEEYAEDNNEHRAHTDTTLTDESIDSDFARFNTIITSLKALDDGYSSKNYKDSKIVKGKGERRSLSLKAKKESSDEESLTSRSKDEEYAMTVKDLKKFFKRRGRFIKQPHNDKKTFQISHDDKSGKSNRKCFRCEYPNHLIRECLKPSRDKNQRDFVGGTCSDSGEEDDKKDKDKTCFMAQASNEVHYESSYFSDENSSIDDITLDSEYNKLCKMSLKIITKNNHFEATGNSLEKEISEIKDKISKLAKNKEIDLGCTTCQSLITENRKLKEEASKLS
nr:zf-CCHC domain-containing protein/DUF4219 domain-containing protein/UBN2 domain-containing protein [Tanacetum cinerariifolium]